MELFNYYSLDECLDLKKVKKILAKFEKEGKIEYSIDRDILKITDLDLDESELDKICETLDSNDIFPYPDYAADGDYERDDYDDFEDDEEENF